jgi:hypothetical protein
MSLRKVVGCLLGATALVAAASSPAHAQSIIKNPGDHPDYKVELEPHGVFGWANHWASNGFGLGLRATIPIVQNGFVKTINNSVGISFGLDWLRYDGCYYYDRRAGRYDGYGCGASFFLVPVTMQWNFWLTPKWSVFGEPGLYVYHGVFDDYCDPRFIGCTTPSRTSVGPALYAGGRFHFSDTVSLTMRLGYPSISLGVSFFL